MNEQTLILAVFRFLNWKSLHDSLKTWAWGVTLKRRFVTSRLIQISSERLYYHKCKVHFIWIYHTVIPKVRAIASSESFCHAAVGLFPVYHYNYSHFNCINSMLCKSGSVFRYSCIWQFSSLYVGQGNYYTGVNAHSWAWYDCLNV